MNDLVTELLPLLTTSTTNFVDKLKPNGQRTCTEPIVCKTVSSNLKRLNRFFFLKEIRDSLGDELEMQPLTRASD
jgi:hypothetical protein